MKVSLPGLFANVKSAIVSRERDYYSFCLDEVLAHIRGVVSGKHSIEEFAAHYCLGTSAEGAREQGDPAEQAAPAEASPAQPASDAGSAS